MKIVVAPDSFKGTLTATQVARIAADAFRARFPSADIVELPVADGGEGSLDCLYQSMGGRIVRKRVRGPFFEAVDARLLITPDGYAVVETAEAIGLPLAGERKNPMLTTTYGVGELLAEAMGEGAKEIVLTLGGSSTNDGGIGMAVALGLKAYGADGKEYLPTGGTLGEIKALDFTYLDSRIKKTVFRALCDVRTKLCGTDGAAYVFAPQKGAKPEDLPLLDQGLKHLDATIEMATGKSYLSLEGGGAAGGLGAGAAAFLGASLVRGIETILDLIRFDEQIRDADIVVTGEGRVDNQSFMGKVLSGIAGRVAKTNAGLYLLAGSCRADEEALTRFGVRGVSVTGPEGRSMEEIRKTAASDLYAAALDMKLN